MGLYHGGNLDATSILEQFLGYNGGGAAPSVDAMTMHLDGMLAESVAHLTECSAGQVLPVDLRGGLVEAIYEVCRLKDDLLARGLPVATGDAWGGAMAGLTRRAMADAERVGLFTAFRDRCASLSGRLDADEAAEAALDELLAGVRMLARSVQDNTGL